MSDRDRDNESELKIVEADASRLVVKAGEGWITGVLNTTLTMRKVGHQPLKLEFQGSRGRTWSGTLTELGKLIDFGIAAIQLGITQEAQGLEHSPRHGQAHGPTRVRQEAAGELPEGTRSLARTDHE